MQIETEQRAAYQAQLARLLASRVFHNTDSLRRLLSYLGEKTIAGANGELKEYTVGVEAFGKPIDYNPQTDASVRVQAGKLRQKLDEYYRTEGVTDPIKVNFPKGGFQLFFQREETAPANIVAMDASALSPTVSPAPTNLVSVRRWQVCCAVLLGLLVVVSALALRWRAQGGRPVSAAEWEARAWTPEMAMFWQPYLEGNRPVLLSLGMPLFARFDGGFFRDPTLNEWETAQTSPRVKELQTLWGGRAPNAAYIYTGVGEATAALLLYKSLLALQREPQIKRSNLLTWEDIAHNNLIFLGSPKYNRHLRDLPVRRDFVIESGNLQNLRPAPGEPAVYNKRFKDGVAIEAHALISRFPGLHGRGEMTMIESSDTNGTGAAAVYLTSAELMRELVNRLRGPAGRLPRAFQVVIKANFQSQVPVQIAYVTHRTLE